MTDFSSFDRIQRAFENGQVGAQTYFDPNAQLSTELSEKQQKKTEEELNALRAQNAELFEEKNNPDVLSMILTQRIML